MKAPRTTVAKATAAGRGWPWSPFTAFEDADLFALQAVANGTASSGQQQRALAFIRNTICEGERLSFMPGGEDGRRATDFAEGKRFVAVQIRRALNMKPAIVNTSNGPPAMPGAASSDEPTES